MGDDDIPHLDVEVSKDNYRKDFLIVLKKIRPDWKADEVVYKESPKVVNRGLINTMVRCYRNGNPDDSIMIRILNTMLDQFTERSIEISCIKYLYKRDCAPHILATFKTGYCYDFIHGEVLNCLKLREDPIWRRLAEEFAKMHAANMADIPGFVDYKQSHIKKTMDKLIEDYPENMTDPEKNRRFKKYLPDKEAITKEMDEVWAHALLFDSDLVLTHNDTRAENIVWNAETGVAKLVDFEGMGCNHRGIELAGHFQRFGEFQAGTTWQRSFDDSLVWPSEELACRSVHGSTYFEDWEVDRKMAVKDLISFNPTDYSLIPDEEFQLKWIRVYLERYYKEIGRDSSDVTDIDVRRLYVQTRKFELVYLIMMTLMGPPFDEMNVIPDKKLDILGLAIDALKEYYKQKEEILALQLPEGTKKTGNSN